ncbi:MAG: hypothetical protein QOE63_200, partial [Acidimicrobiaceae bacterium]
MRVETLSGRERDHVRRQRVERGAVDVD